MQLPVRTEKLTVGEMPVVVMAPEAAGRYPVVIGLHGLGGNKETMIPLLQPLAAMGYVAAVPDARFHGERFDPVWAQFAQTDERAAVVRAVAETAAELPALLDALLARPDARPAADGGAGICGVSFGALTLYDAVPREPRFTVAVSLIGGGIFPRDPAAEAAMTPEGRAMMEARDVRRNLPAFTHLAFLLLAGADDTRLPTAYTQALYDALAPQMDPARLRLTIEPGIGHEVTFNMATETIGWFRRFLT